MEAFVWDLNFERSVFCLIFLLFVMLNFSNEPLRWWFLFSNKTTLKYKEWLGLFNVTALFGYLLPKFGFPLRLYFIHTKTGLDFSQISSGILVDSLVGYATWTIAAGMSLMLLITTESNLSNFQAKISDSQVGIFLIVPIILILLLAIFYILIRLSKKAKLLKKMLDTLKSFQSKQLLLIILITLVDIAFQIGRHNTLVWAFGCEISILDMGIIVIISCLFGMLSFMPMGLGGYDVTLIFGLTQLSIPLNIATLVVVTNRAASFLVCFLLGLYGASSLRIQWWNFSYYKKIAMKSAKELPQERSATQNNQ